MPELENNIPEEVIFSKSISIEKDDVTIVIPTLNEEKAIDLVIRGLVSENYQNILVVDGNSHDDTLKIAKKMKVKAVTQIGQGKTGAIATAISLVKTPYLVIIDGDYTYNPLDVDKLLEKGTQYCQVIGARTDRENIPFINRFGNRFINILFNLCFSCNLSDVCSGLYLIKTSFAHKLVLESKGFDVEVEIAAQSAMDKVVTEVPISYRSRIGVQKLHPIRDGLKIVYTIIKLAKKHRMYIFNAVMITGCIILFGFSFLLINRIK